MPTRCNRGFFIADLIACSTCFGHHYAHRQELKSIIQWLLPVAFRAVVFKLLVWCGAEGYVSGLQDAAASCKPDTMHGQNHIKFRLILLNFNSCICFLYKKDIKAIPLQAWRDPEGSRRLRLPDFKTIGT